MIEIVIIESIEMAKICFKIAFMYIWVSICWIVVILYRNSLIVIGIIWKVIVVSFQCLTTNN